MEKIVCEIKTKIEPKKVPTPALKAFSICLPPKSSAITAPKKDPTKTPNGGNKKIPSNPPIQAPTTPFLVAPNILAPKIGAR